MDWGYCYSFLENAEDLSNLQTHLYLGLLLMCGFVLFDTQLIIEKRRMGNKDFVQHALELFIDFIGVFRRLVIILTQKVYFNFTTYCLLDASDKNIKAT